MSSGETSKNQLFRQVFFFFLQSGLFLVPACDLNLLFVPKKGPFLGPDRVRS